MSPSTPESSRRRVSMRRRLPLAALGAALTLGLTVPALPAMAQTAPAAGQDETYTLKRGDFSVTVDRGFPRVLSYDWGQDTLGGNADELHEFSINSKTVTAKTSARKAGNKVTYTSTFPDSEDFSDLTIVSELKVSEAGRLDFRVVSVKGDSEAKVNQLSIPGWSLVSAGEGGTLSRTTTDVDSTRQADRHVKLKAGTKADAKAVGSPYAFVAEGDLAAGVITNATPDVEQSSNDNSNSRLSTRISAVPNGGVRASVSPGTFTWAPKGATDQRVARYDLPSASVVLSRDANADQNVDWQDAAIAQRAATPTPKGAERVPERVLQRIPFNIVSEATNPFRKTLDQTESLAANSDGLGQYVLLKGFGSEGHDSANTDYGGHPNERAGGLDEMNALLKQGDKLNADFSVHVNTTEAYPQARSFSDRLIKGQKQGWNWMNQSFGIDQRYDLGSGGVLDRFAALKKDAPKLDGVYIDVYYSSGWLASELASQLQDQGLEVATEWAYKHEGDSLWSHWANDRNYGGETNKGLNSQMIRFMFNSQRDVWNPDPLLGGVDLQDFEGWQGKVDRTKYMQGTWESNLPTKYLQHFDLMTWEDKTSATFTDGVSVKVVDGKRVVRQGGVEVQRGDTYLLPWQSLRNSSTSGSPLKADNMYFHPGTTGSHTFHLTQRFAGNKDFTLYRLTDNGRTEAVKVKAVDGKVKLRGQAGEAYVLVPKGGAKGVTPVYGAGTKLTDPGFTSGSLEGMNYSGAVDLATNSRGDGVARLGASKDAWKNWVGQSVKGLKPGKRYAFTAQVATPAGEQRVAALNVSGGHGKDVWEWKDVGPTTLKNQVGSSSKHSTYSQQARLDFVAPKNGKVDLSVLAGPGTGNVEVDDLRIIELKNLKADDVAPVSKEGVWDFEDNVPGYGPFLRGDTESGIGDAQTSISERHDPYTSRQWRN
jgi:endo-alpha-N-acetylgalactosaminidase